MQGKAQAWVSYMLESDMPMGVHAFTCSRPCSTRAPNATCHMLAPVPAQANPSNAWSSLPWWVPRRDQWWQNAIKAVVLGLSILLDYWNMLVSVWIQA